MSDPVTNSEVEDVLSSIRRLVSEDKRPLQATRAEPRNDRLVLTPALRVADPKPEDASIGLKKPDQNDYRTVAPSIQSLITDDEPIDVYGDGGGRFKRPSEWPADPEPGLEQETSRDDPSEDYSADPYNFDDEEDDDGEGMNLLRPKAEPEEEIAAEPQEQPQARHPAEEDTVPDVDDPDADYDDQNLYWDDEDEAEAVEDAEDEDEAVTDAEPEKAETLTAEREVHQAEAEPEVPTSDIKASVLNAKIEALETAIANIADAWEPDDAGESDYAGTEPEAMAWEDNEPDTGPAPRLHFAPLSSMRADSDTQEDDTAETEEDTPFVRRIQPTAEAPKQAAKADTSTTTATSGLDLGEDELLDEEALRDLVSEIVRAELQGALGERITRNVRKLVRREIHRALTAQELE